MAIKVDKEVNRLPGLLPKSGIDIVAGYLVMLDGDTLKPFDGTAGLFPLGLAADTTKQFPIAPADGQVVGTGYNYTDFARGGLVGVFLNGGVFTLFDDGRGHPVDTTQVYAQNKPVFGMVDGSGRITSDGSGGKPRVGSIYNVTGSGAAIRLQIKLEI